LAVCVRLEVHRLPEKLRPRDYGLCIGLLPTGPHNAITDVPGVRVGHVTLNYDEPAVARTGVTAIWPGPDNPFRDRVYAGSFVLNGYGEIIARTVVDEWGLLDSPILLTNSMSIGTVYEGAVRYFIERDELVGRADILQPVVGECDDSVLNDSRVLHVRPEHAVQALEAATSGPVAEGCVGAGTGMQCFEFKGGIGTASRIVAAGGERFTLGVLVLTNFGRRDRLTIDGVYVGREITDLMPKADVLGEGSCIVIVATDAPLHPQQCARVAKRAALGLGRVGSTAADGSGEIILAFSNAQTVPRHGDSPLHTLRAPLEGGFIWGEGGRLLDELFAATVEATEEAVVNALFAAETTVGRDGNTLYALPVDRCLEILARQGRLVRRDERE
jgi:D-aminopeptidase